MLAWALHSSPGEYAWGEVDDPVAGPGEVRLRVMASALNHMDHWLTIGRPRPPVLPHVPGTDVAGVVESVGEGVDGWSPGDEVVANTALVPAAALARGHDAVLDPGLRLLGEQCWGGHGELCVVPAHHLVPRPPGRTWAECAAYPTCLTTAVRLLRRARLGPGQVVLVTGIGGGVATAAMVLALHVGAEVHVSSRNPAKREAALALGAAGAHDTTGDLGGLTVDVVLDSIGPVVWEQAYRALRPGGRMCIAGSTTGRTVELDLPRLFWRQLEVIGGTIGSQDDFEHATRLMADGLPVVVDDVVPLAGFPAALERLRAGEQLGKIVLDHAG
jgi:NADPH:quinone reductase-like Zn-dependent oxidoreductase